MASLRPYTYCKAASRASASACERVSALAPGSVSSEARSTGDAEARMKRWARMERPGDRAAMSVTSRR